MSHSEAESATIQRYNQNRNDWDWQIDRGTAQADGILGPISAMDHRCQPISSPNVQALISESFLSHFEWLYDLMGALHEKLDYGAARSILERNH